MISDTLISGKTGHGLPLWLIERATWWGFLVVLAVAGFISDIYPSPLWLLVTAALFFLLALHFFGVALGGYWNSKGVRSALPVLLLLGLTLLWLLLQIYLPVQNYAHKVFLSSELAGTNTPDWFVPTFRWSVNSNGTQQLLLSEIMMVAVLYLTLALLRSRRRLFQMLLVFTLVGLIHAIAAIIAKYATISLVDVNQLDGHFTVARGWFINRNHLAAFLILALVGPLSLQFRQVYRLPGHSTLRALLDQLSGRQLLVLVSIAVMAIAVLLSLSRAGLLGLIVVLVFSASLVVKRVGSSQLNGTVLIPLIVTVLVIGFYFSQGMLSRFSSSEALLGERAEQWSATWALIQQNLLLGYGGNSYATVFQFMREHDGLRQLVYNQAHNDYLHIWLEQGLVGLFLWIMIFFFVFRFAWVNLKKSPSSLVRGALLAALVAILTALIQAFFDFNLQILNIRIYFFVIIAMIFSIPNVRHRKKPIRYT